MPNTLEGELYLSNLLQIHCWLPLLQIFCILIMLGRLIQNELTFRWIYMQLMQLQVMFVQYQECRVVKRHWNTLSLGI